MPSTIKTKGILLKIKDTPGKDKLVYILTPSGLIKTFMTPKRNAGKKSYAVDLFTCGEVVLFETDSGNYLVNSITPQESFYSLREEISTLYTASYFASLAIHASGGIDTDCQALYDLLFYALSALCGGGDPKKIKPAFELKLSQLLGMSPCLEAENKAASYYFALEDGRLYVHDAPDSIHLARSAVLCIYNILNANEKTVFSVDIPNEFSDILYNLSERYLIYHTEYNFDTLRILNGVI